MARLDEAILRIARKLTALQNVKSSAVIVPRAVASAFRDLDRARAVSEKVLHGDRAAGEQLIARIGGRTPLPPGSRPKSRPLSARASVLLAQAQRGPIDGPMCSGDALSNMTILQAAFQLDAALGHRDARLTARAADYIQNRRGVVRNFEDRVNGRMGGAAFDPAGGLGTGEGVPQGGDGSFLGYYPTPLFPPHTETPDFGDPLDPLTPDGGLCQELGDLCAQLFNEFAAAAMGEDDARLIATVQPNCLCAGAFNAGTVFTARPDANQPFPAAQGEYHLIFRGQDISARIDHWSAQEIRFTIPADSSTGYVWLTRYINSMSSGISTALANLCGVPAIGGRGINLPPSPRALISIVRAPVIYSFRINGQAVQQVETEACHAVRFDWSVRLDDQTAGQPLPPCCSIQITIRDENGDRLHSSTDPIGSWLHNPERDTVYHLFAESMAGKIRCGQAGPSVIDVRRERRLYVEPHVPALPKTVAGKTGTLNIRMSCAAPDDGAVVNLTSSDPGILRVPDTVQIFPGEDSAIVSFSTNSENAGAVRITVRLAGHRDGVLDYEVLRNLTAIVLSGGGAKGSFEIGALFYLREIWNDVRPRIVCGSSVGAINGLAVAESVDGAGIDKLETIWLGLQYPSDMYVLSPEFQRVFDDLGINVPDVIMHGASLPFDSIPSLLSYLARIGVSPSTAGWVAAGWAAGGPVGAVIGGLISIGGDDADKINNAIANIQKASYAFDLQPTQDKIQANISSARVAQSGMTLRLAVVAVQDGDLYYVTEAGHLLRGQSANASFDEPIVNAQVLVPLLPIDPAVVLYPGFVRDPLVAGTMASAAFPGIFQVRPLFTASSFQHYMDGGVRQVLPTRAAVELGAQLIFAIAASPLAAGTSPFVYPAGAIPNWNSGRNYAVGDLVTFHGNDYQCLAAHTSQEGLEPFRFPTLWKVVTRAALLPIIQRAIGLEGNELDLSIRAPRGGFCDQVERVAIWPAFEVHDTVVIDPGLIRINAAYGYFRAFDADQLRRNNNLLQYLLWQLWTDDLIGTRLLCHQIEAGAKITSPAAGEFAGGVLNVENLGTRGMFNHGTLQQVRNSKNHIAELIVQRFETFGVNAFPRTMRDAVMGNQSVLDWAGTWEVHPDPRRRFLNAVDLWAAQQLTWGETVSDDPYIFVPGTQEMGVVPRFPIPDAVRNALAGR